MITMTDIANKAGVSRSAVSVVLNDIQNTRIPTVTRQRILEAAAELGYRPNELARAVASGKTRMIGYLISEPDYEPYWTIVVGALGEAEEAGFTLKVLSVKAGKLEERVHQCIELRLSGLIVSVIGDRSVIFEEAERAHIPVVTVDNGTEQPFGSRVSADDSIGCKQVIEHLTHLGHRRIAFISSGFPQFHTGPGDKSDIGTVREKLFLSEMQARGLSVPEGYITYETMLVFDSPLLQEDHAQRGLEATEALLSHPEGRPTAIFCWRDEAAMVAIRACRKRGLRVPEDISIVGFSDIRAARFCDPPLSTVKSPWGAIGQVAIHDLQRQWKEGMNTRPSTHLIPSQFVARQSTGPAPSSGNT